MRSRRLIFFYLFILFTGIIAQKYENNLDEVDDEDSAPTNNKGQSQSKLSAGNTNNNGVYAQQNANQIQQPGGPPAQSQLRQGQVNALPPSPSGQSAGDSAVRLSQAQRPVESNSRSQSTQLAADDDCKADIQKYCAKGSRQLLSNLKVLQCVDDLDNVSFSK